MTANSSAATSRRTEKNEMRREQIIQAAVTVLREKGVSNTSMNDIIRVSGLSKGGVYHHFESKETLLIGVLEHFFAQYVSDLSPQNLAAESAYEKMRQLLTERQETLERVGELNQLMLDMLTHAIAVPSIKRQFHLQYCYFQDEIVSILKLGIERGEFRDDTDVVAIASGILAVFDGLCSALIIAPDRVRFPDHGVVSALALLEGIAVKS